MRIGPGDLDLWAEEVTRKTREALLKALGEVLLEICEEANRDIVPMMIPGSFSEDEKLFVTMDVRGIGVEIQSPHSFFMWWTQGDERVCEECRARHGLLFIPGKIAGPGELHPNCRCFETLENDYVRNWLSDKILAWRRVVEERIQEELAKNLPSVLEMDLGEDDKR